jgi:hypothetical protein
MNAFLMHRRAIRRWKLVAVNSGLAEGAMVHLPSNTT